MRNLDLDSIAPRKKALACWERIAGERLAGFCDPPVLDEGTLVVRVKNPAAGMELKYRSREIISALNKEAGVDVFRNIKVVLRPGNG